MATIEDLAERIEQLLARHDELKRSNALLEHRLAEVIAQRDQFKHRLGAARARLDALIERLPAESPSQTQTS